MATDLSIAPRAAARCCRDFSDRPRFGALHELQVAEAMVLMLLNWWATPAARLPSAAMRSARMSLSAASRLSVMSVAMSMISPSRPPAERGTMVTLQVRGVPPAAGITTSKEALPVESASDRACPARRISSPSNSSSIFFPTSSSRARPSARSRDR